MTFIWGSYCGGLPLQTKPGGRRGLIPSSCPVNVIVLILGDINLQNIAAEMSETETGPQHKYYIPKPFVKMDILGYKIKKHTSRIFVLKKINISNFDLLHMFP